MRKILDILFTVGIALGILMLIDNFVQIKMKDAYQKGYKVGYYDAEMKCNESNKKYK